MRFLLYHNEENNTSDDRRKRLLQTGAIILLIADAIFVASYLTTPDSMAWWLYVGVSGVSITTFFLLRFNRITVACYFFVLSLNIVIYLVMSSEPIRTAFHLHMITAAFVALNLFGYKQRFAGITFATFSFALGLLGYSREFMLLEFRNYTNFEIKLYFVINTILFICISCYLLMVMLQWNFSTEQVALESKVQAETQNQQISKTNSELDRFVFKISHDLRAPLNTLSGLANLAESDPSQRPDYFRLMKNQILVMERFIREVADYSKNARLDVNNQTIILKRLLEEIIQSISHLDDFSKVAIAIEVEESAMIESDELRLKIILANLLTNGIKYYDSKKAVPQIKIKLVLSDAVKIFISDNGIGIAEDHDKRIFDMFYKATDRSKGTGLGLYMVRETLRKLNGQIDFHSELHKGTTFIVTLPLVQR